MKFLQNQSDHATAKNKQIQQGREVVAEEKKNFIENPKGQKQATS